MAGIETLARLAGVKIPEPVRFALNPTAYILGELYKQIETSSGLPANTFQTITNPAGAIKDYVKTEAGNALLDQSNTSNIEQILNALQPNRFEQARLAGETPMSVPSSIEMPTYDANSLAGLGSLEIPDYFGGRIEQADDFGKYGLGVSHFGGGKGFEAEIDFGDIGNDFAAYAKGGKIYIGKR